MERQIYDMHQIYKDIQNQKSSLISDIRHLSKDNLERIERLDKQTKSLDIEGQIRRLKQINQGVPEPDKSKPASLKSEKQPVDEKKPEETGENKEARDTKDTKEAKDAREAREAKEPSTETSFFDEIE